MTGSEHYRAAERLLSDATFTAFNSDQPVDRQGKPISDAARAMLLACAQVHAQLALAAAMVNDLWGRAQILGHDRDQT